MAEKEAEYLRLAYSSSYDQLQSQKDDLRAIRGQASLAIAFITFLGTFGATFLGSDGLRHLFADDGELHFLGLSVSGVVLLTVLAVSLALSILVVVRVGICVFSLTSETYLHFAERETEEMIAFRHFLSEMDKHFENNEAVISSARVNLTLALALGWVQLFPWMLLWAEARHGN
ncbi:hypothetical protein [Jannaschia seohaensis]|uniref:hypothetical protein n=1 Tax=Jannaschia seohaensis TaxID=475081 RepID=UPI0011B255A4|nr:hypothetical protein [Jannaschia seohaensis]